MNLGSARTSVVVRVLILLLLSTLFTVASPTDSDARVCPDGTIQDQCTAPACRNPDDPLGCYPEPPVSPPGSCGSNQLSFHPPLTIQGSVRGPGDAGVPDACVYWVTSWGHGSVKTDGGGLFAIDVAADAASTFLYVRKDYMTWDSETVTTTEYALDPAKRIRFDISFTQGVSVSPFAFNNSEAQTVTVSVVSAAPSAERALAEPLPGTVITLTRDTAYTGPTPLSRWIGTTTIPAGLAEGVKEVPTCILSAGGSGSCTSSGSDVVYAGIPQVGFRGLFAVDNTPPTAGWLTPKDLHNTLDTTPTIAITPADTFSGPDANRTQVFLDGVPLGSGHWVEPAQPLSLGVHSVTATIWDLAGNSSIVAWQFAVTSLEGGAATVTVTPKTVTVPPQGLPGWCCQYVTFTDIQTKLSGYDLRLAGSPLWAGQGSVARRITHTNLKVTFRNAAQEVTVSVPWASSDYQSEVAVLEPNAEDLGVNIRETPSKIYYIGVYVPQGFVVTNDTTATVYADVENVVTETVAPALEYDPLPLALSTTGTVSGIVRCNISSTPVHACEGAWPEVYFNDGATRRFVLGYFSVAWNRVNLSERSLSYPRDPLPNPVEPSDCDTAGGWTCDNVLLSGSPDTKLFTYWSSGSLFNAYGHHYLYSVTSTSRDQLVVWQASDVDIGTYTSSATGQRTSCLYQFGNTSRAMRGTWTSNASLFDATRETSDPEYLPSIDRFDSDGFRIKAKVGEGVDLDNLRNGLDVDGLFRSDPAKSVTIKLTEAPGVALQEEEGPGSFNTWIPNQGKRRTNTTLLTAATYSGGSLSDFDVRFATYFEFGLATSSC